METHAISFTTMKIAPVLLGFLSLSSIALSSEPWEGDYVWSNSGTEQDYGSVHQSVTVNVAVQNDGKVGISCEVLWTPGVDADFGATVERSAMFDRVLGNGRTAKIIPFTFTDSNDNQGAGELEIDGATATLRIWTTEKAFPEAARQYGTYHLSKQSS
jgi:hypothetical protein